MISTTIVCSRCMLHYCQSRKQTAEALLELYTEWIEKYPITAVTEPFGPTDELLGTALMERGDAFLATKQAKALQEVSVCVHTVHYHATACSVVKCAI
jgi:enolase